jgi:hypothetical protein
MDYYPTKTYSGTPYLSTEQRAFFIKQRDEMLAETPELAYFEDIKRYSGIWDRLDWKAFMKHDNHQIGTHPIHVAFRMLDEYRRVYDKRMFELESAKAIESIPLALYEVLKFDLDINKDYVESQFCVKAKADFHKKYAGIQDTQKFVERLGATINERLNAVASRKDEGANEGSVACVG